MIAKHQIVHVDPLTQQARMTVFLFIAIWMDCKIIGDKDKKKIMNLKGRLMEVLSYQKNIWETYLKKNGVDIIVHLILMKNFSSIIKDFLILEI